jgi:hypothetical protein
MYKIAMMLYVFGSFVFYACAGSNTAALLDSGVGKMTYEEAVQHFGKPFECTDSGVVKRCTWVNWRGRRYQPDMGVVQMAVGNDPPVAVLTFKHNVLSDWHLSGTWK